MIINISDILKIYGAAVDIDDDISLPETVFLGEDFVFDSPVHITGKIVNNGKALELNAHCRGVMTVHCARCTKQIQKEFEFKVREHFMRDDGEVTEDEDIVLFEGYEIDITDIVVNHFLMNVSARYVCSEDCRGLCPVCGKDLNEGECGCESETIDPRWAGLADILNKSFDKE